MSGSKPLATLLAVAGMAMSLAAVGAMAAETAAHKHEPAHAPAKLTLNAGKKWPTDEPLRAGMAAIRAAMEPSLADIHAGKFSTAGYDQLAKSVSAQVAGIVANCKLDPAADAQLHLIIAQIMAGVEAMEGKTRATKRQAGAIKVLDALDKYRVYFDHPGWKPITH